MPAVRSLIAAHQRGDAGSLRALAIALAATVVEEPPTPTDPVALLEQVESAPPAAPGTWQEVAAARDTGDLTPAEYDYLVAAVEALKMEDDS